MNRGSIRGNLAVQEAGFLPAGIVVGAATYQVMRPQGCAVRMQRRGSWRSSALEYSTYADGVTRTWNDAVAALEHEAVERGAHGVAGVTMTQEWLTTSASTFQVQLIGSAVTVRGVPPLSRPFVSMLSMEQTLKLLLRGWIPAGVGMGVCAVHVHGYATSAFWQGGATSNMEMEQPTERMRHTRRQAEIRLRQSPHLRYAQGVVDASLKLEYENESCRVGTGMRVIGQMTGTGVVRFGQPTVGIDVAMTMSRGIDGD